MKNIINTINQDAVPASQSVPTSAVNTRPSKQLKLLNTNIHDDLLELLLSSQSVADKFYNTRTLKSSRELRKIYLQVSKLALLERKRIIQNRKSRQAKQ
jgi:hypothetical protein